MVFGALYTWYGHGQASSPASDMNGDLIDLCYSAAKSEAGEQWHRNVTRSTIPPSTRQTGGGFERRERKGGGEGTLTWCARGGSSSAECSDRKKCHSGFAGAAQCMAKGHAITEFSDKQQYMAKISNALKHCPYKVPIQT